jgi:hypothetical protein
VFASGSLVFASGSHLSQLDVVDDQDPARFGQLFQHVFCVLNQTLGCEWTFGGGD